MSDPIIPLLHFSYFIFKLFLNLILDFNGYNDQFAMKYDINNFEEEVIKKSFDIPVLVDFWAEWCGPCKILGPVLEKLADQAGGSWTLAKLDTDKNPEISAKYGIRGIPNVKLFINGEVADEFTGALPEHSVVEWLKKSIPGKHQKDVERAKHMIDEGKSEEAKQILKAVAQAEPGNKTVKVLTAKLKLFDNPEKSLEILKDFDPDPEDMELTESILTLASALNLNGKADSLPDSAAKSLYLSAIEDLHNQNFDDALSNFINVIREDRYYDDDGARKACIAIFKYLGEENEITLKHRRDFGGALYV